MEQDTYYIDIRGLDGYADWVEYQHSKNEELERADEEWYKKRLGWVSRFRNMEEWVRVNKLPAIFEQRGRLLKCF